MNLGGVQFIPTAMTFLHASAIEAHSTIESPLTTLTPSFELKENQAGVFMLPSSRSSAYACEVKKDFTKIMIKLLVSCKSRDRISKSQDHMFSSNLHSKLYDQDNTGDA